MWIMMKRGFVSVVQDSTRKGVVVVRSRRRTHLEAFLEPLGVDPAQTVRETSGTDYRFRAYIDQSVAADLVRTHVQDIDYPNFKDAASRADREDGGDHDYPAALGSVWRVMERLQPGGAYGWLPGDDYDPAFDGEDDGAEMSGGGCD